MISGFSDFKYTRLAIQAGVIDYILKPVDPQNLNNALSATISQLESEAGKTGTSDSASSPEPCSTFTSRVISDVFDYINAHYDVTLEYEHPSCHYSKLNKQCIKERCPYYG